jgi:dihydropteroate synthase
MQALGTDPGGIQIMVPKGLFYAIRLDDVHPIAALLLKQEMLSKGGEVAVSQELYRLQAAPDGVLILGTEAHYRRLIPKLRLQPLRSLRAIADELQAVLDRAWAHPPPLTIGPLTCRWGTRTFVMGILNVTPDSFSGDGLLAGAEPGSPQIVEAALRQAQRMVEEGADLLDVGGESTRPGSKPLPAEEEMRRVVPVVERLARELPVPISIDTYKATVAEAALDAGAHLVNDVWALAADPEMASLVARRQVPVILMHNRSRRSEAAIDPQLGGRYQGTEYRDLLGDVIAELRERVSRALEAGIARERIIVDPGIGFGKTVEQNLELLDRLRELRVLGQPLLVGTSRKSFTGYTLKLPPEQRLEGTAASVALAIDRGADIVRVHDVLAMVRVSRLSDAVVRRRRTMATVYLGLGANLGDREANLKRACRELEAGGVPLDRCSSFYETEPWGVRDQPPFLNAACRGHTGLAPAALLALAKRIERDVGRVPTVRFGPRAVDIDILLYEDLILASPELTIPHPGLAERPFVLVPLAEIAPGLRVPGLGQTVRELLEALGETGGVRPVGMEQE